MDNLGTPAEVHGPVRSIGPGTAQTPTFLYRFFDQESRLLYVGITYHLEGRFDVHRYQKPWDQIARIQVEQFPTRQAAVAAEQEAIRSEGPKWNILHTAPVKKDPHRRPRTYLAEAKLRWPRAEWVIGSGRFASLAHCRDLTIILYDTEETALKGKNWIDRCGCGGRCVGDHEIIDLGLR